MSKKDLNATISRIYLIAKIMKEVMILEVLFQFKIRW
jgi:hypothetical protein